MIEKRRLLTATTVECEVGGPTTFGERFHRRRRRIAAHAIVIGAVGCSSPTG